MSWLSEQIRLQNERRNPTQPAPAPAPTKSAVKPLSLTQQNYGNIPQQMIMTKPQSQWQGYPYLRNQPQIPQWSNYSPQFSQYFQQQTNPYLQQALASLGPSAQQAMGYAGTAPPGMNLNPLLAQNVQGYFGNQPTAVDLANINPQAMQGYFGTNPQ